MNLTISKLVGCSSRPGLYTFGIVWQCMQKGDVEDSAVLSCEFLEGKLVKEVSLVGQNQVQPEIYSKGIFMLDSLCISKRVSLTQEGFGQQ